MAGGELRRHQAQGCGGELLRAQEKEGYVRVREVARKGGLDLGRHLVSI